MNSADRSRLKEIFHATVNLAPSERDTFLAASCAGDPGLYLDVTTLLAAHDSAGGFIVQSAFCDVGLVAGAEAERSTAVSGQRIGNYRIIRELGRGGMGSVYLAARADESLDRMVALKLIKRGMDSDAIIKRFVLERQILANLDHPNIARLIDGGTTDDGLPYFVMENVAGQNINRYCDSHQLNTRDRLRLFRQVCEAVQFAHQNLIVHRDLKPSNIIVTDDGTPKLLDFGIAKLLSGVNATEVTASIGRALTPEYASPEELRGHAVTTAGDVYSLGVVLYELLSGHRPFSFASRSPEDVVRVIGQGPPIKPSVAVTLVDADRDTAETTPPSGTPDAISRVRHDKLDQVRRRLIGDLDNILLKALRSEPERRYLSVQEFSADLRRHLEGLPVTASPDRFSYRARKFTRRHRAGVLAAAIVAVSLVSATGITTWQARVARRERQKSEQRFNDVRKLANSVVFELHDSIQNLPGSTPARELLVTRALEYLDRLAVDAEHDQSLQLDLAAAYDKIGDIQGGFAAANLGQEQKANESYRKALAIRESLVTTEPANFEFRRRLATSYAKMGQILWVETDVPGSLEYHRKALSIDRVLAEEAPDDADLRFELALAYLNFGYLSAASGHADEGLGNVRKAVELFEAQAAARPDNQKVLSALAMAYARVGNILELAKGNYPEAIVFYQKSQRISDAQVTAEPLNVKFERGQAVGLLQIAGVAGKLGDDRSALESARGAVSIFTQMLAADPQNEEMRELIAAGQTEVGKLMTKTGSPEEAIALLDRSRQTLEQMFAHSPADQTIHFRIAVVEQELGNGYGALATADRTKTPELAHWREARSWFQKSREIYQVFHDAGKTTGEDGARLDVVVAQIAKCDEGIARLAGGSSDGPSR